MFIFDLTNPAIILTILALSVLFIVLGKELKESVLPLVALIVILLIIIYNFAMLIILPEEYQNLKTTIMRSCLYNLFLIFMNFIGYLWIDDIEARFKNKKSIDNSLSWFWNTI